MRGFSYLGVEDAGLVDALAPAFAGEQQRPIAKQAVCLRAVVKINVWPSLLPEITGYCDTTPASCSISTGKSKDDKTSPAMRKMWASF